MESGYAVYYTCRVAVFVRARNAQEARRMAAKTIDEIGGQGEGYDKPFIAKRYDKAYKTVKREPVGWVEVGQ